MSRQDATIGRRQALQKPLGKYNDDTRSVKVLRPEQDDWIISSGFEPMVHYAVLRDWQQRMFGSGARLYLIAGVLQPMASNIDPDVGDVFHQKNCLIKQS